MSRINTPSSIDSAPVESQEMLKTVEKNLGIVPNMFRLISNTPAALEGYLGMSTALSKGTLPPQTRERIALALAQFNSCGYCLSAHTYLGKNLAKLSDSEITANRSGTSTDPKAGAAVSFALKIAKERGHISDDDLRKVRLAGYNDAQLIEIVEHVALNVFTNYLNVVSQTEIDFPTINLDMAS